MTGDEQVRLDLQTLIADVALARAGGDEYALVEVLLDAILFYPVFASWPSPLVDEWIAEAEALVARQENTTEIEAMMATRRAHLAMRRGDLDGALAQVERIALPDWAAAATLHRDVTRARIQTRAHRFDEASAALRAAEALAPRAAPDLFVHDLLAVARAELAVERSDARAPEAVRAALLATRFELIEERVELHQLLAFAAVIAVDPAAALRHFEVARDLLAGAGVESEILLMDLACGSLHLAIGDVTAAEADFADALRIAGAHPRPELEPLVRLGAARARAAAGDHAAAVREALEGAMAFARAGNALGYLGVIAYLHALHLQAEDHEEAYRILATGLAIARRMRLSTAEHLFRTLVDRMRDHTIGPERFDRMVEQMIRDARS